MKGIGFGFWDSVLDLARAYDNIMGLLIFMPIVILSWFPFVSEFQTRILFNQAFSRGLQISMILSGKRDKTGGETGSSDKKDKMGETGVAEKNKGTPT